MSLAKFRQKYPQGSLVSELIEIDRGTYIVQASVQINNLVLATGLASAATVEAAEDAARDRAIAILFLDQQSSSLNVPAAAQVSPTVSPTSPQPKPKPKADSPTPPPPIQPEPIKETIQQEQALTPATVPLKPVAEVANPSSQPEIPTTATEPAVSNTLFGDTFNAESPTLEPIESEDSNLAQSEPNSMAQELEAMDFNEIKQKTDIEIKRLSWTKEQGKEFLMSRYGKRSRLHLTDEQLLEFLRYLETLPNPVK